MAAHRLTDADLERWVQSGLISVDQRDAMLRDLEAHQPTEDGLSVTTILYYSGGLLVLLAYSVFLGFQWEELNEGGRVAISLASLIFFAAVSQVLVRSGRYRLPGELLEVVAVAVVPLLGFALLDVAGLWPDDPGYRRQALRETYYEELSWARMALAGTTLIVALAAFRWSRSPFVMVAAAVSFTFFALEVVLQIEGPRRDYPWDAAQSLTIAGLAAAAIATGALVRERGGRDYAMWLYLLGVVGLALGLSDKAFDSYQNEAAWGVLWMVTAFILLAISVPLQQRLFAAAGLAAIFGFLAKLVFDVFESANAALVLIVIGLLVLGLGMLYQRYNERLFARP